MYNRKADLHYRLVSNEVLDSLDLYGKEGRPTGDFLKAVLSNDLFAAYSRADFRNIACMYEICMYIYNELPAPSWGSPEKVAQWIEQHRQQRLASQKPAV